jgi:hypothetical protein
MGRNSWGEVVAAQHAAGTLLTTFTTAKSILNTQAQTALNPQFWYPGKYMEIQVRGAISNIVTTPGTIQFLVKLGTVASPITVWDSGAIQMTTTAHATWPFRLEVSLKCDTEGSGTTAKLMSLGQLTGAMFVKSTGADIATGDTSILVPKDTNPVVSTGFDSNISNVLDLFAGFSISNSGNGVRIDQYTAVAWDIP